MAQTPFGTCYETGTSHVVLTRDSNGQTAVVAIFGNRFSENAVPLTRQAALDLRNQLDAALHVTAAGDLVDDAHARHQSEVRDHEV